MNAPRKGPRADSQGYRALEQLHKLGGEAHITALMNAVKWPGSITMFDREIVGPLLRYQVATRPGTRLVLTDSGRVFLGLAVATPAPAPSPDIPLTRYVAPMRPLSARHIARVAVMRAGALDYRDIPSRVGDMNIAHRTAAAA